MPKLSAVEVRVHMIDAAVKGLRGLGHKDVTRRSLFDNPKHRDAFRRLVRDAAENPESDEMEEAAGMLLKELGPGGGDD